MHAYRIRIAYIAWAMPMATIQLQQQAASATRQSPPWSPQWHAVHRRRRRCAAVGACVGGLPWARPLPACRDGLAIMWRTLVPLALALPGSTSRRGCFTQLPGPLDAEPVSALTATLVAALTNAEGGGLDWRRHGAVSPVQQQHPFGTCWSFGSTGTLEGIMVVQGNRTLQKLSEQQLISCETLDSIKGGPSPDETVMLLASPLHPY